MADLGVHRILLLVISLMKCLEGTKLLADFKKCGDVECETLISRVLATRDYRGPDCRFLNFTTGEEISVYVKLAGEREDLWAGSKGKDFGYFPRDAVQIEEVFISEEIKISTKESDFFCLLEESYIFETEDSALDSDNGKNIYSHEEDQITSVSASDFQTEPGFYSTSESTLLEYEFLTSEAPEDVQSTSKSKDLEEVEAGSVAQGPTPEVDHVPPSSAVPEVKGWLGFGMEQAKEQNFESVTESLHENSFQSRKIAVEDENYLEELNDGESQREYKLKPESESHSMPQKQPALVSESGHNHKTQATGWFGGGFTNYLGFGGEDTELELTPENNLPLQDIPSSISSDEEPTVPCTETLTKKEDTVTNGSSILIPNWFDFGFSMLSFAYANDNKIKLDDERKEGSEGEKHEHPPISEFDLDKGQGVKITKTMETKDQVGKENALEKTDDSGTLPYFQKFLNNFDNPWNFQNTRKETELSFSEHILDENNVAGNDETELFSVESYPTDDKKILMLKSRYSKSDWYKIMESPNGVHEEEYFKNPSKNHGEKSKTSLDTEESIQVETDRSMENNLLNNQMFSGDNSVSSQTYADQKEYASEYQILKYLFQWDIYDFMNSAYSRILILTEKIINKIGPEKLKMLLEFRLQSFSPAIQCSN
ncbi:PREDICTED: melanoma inhibitory activity protein 2 [Condylura cristata]|uniref:melanoma inhibitory activity protein 2 n=1 Tax=Condylura cristata TaxID=143302 RepID=UPI00033478BD|nr:PREDICTED: melanoma inhibitory activity protein 2 [Condylura cristata]